MPPTSEATTQACDLTSNQTWQSFGAGDDAQPTEPNSQGLVVTFLKIERKEK